MLMPLIPNIRISNPFIAETALVSVARLPTMAEIGLNLFQILQNGLLSRETSRSNLGLGIRFASVVERQENCLCRLPQQPGLEAKPHSGARQCALS
jgi:hypothetical protein